MGVKGFSEKRWHIVFGSYAGVEKYAANELYKVIQKYVPYVLTVSYSAEELPKDKNLIFLGTAESNRFIGDLADKKLVTLNLKPQGYAIRVCESPYCEGYKAIAIAGADALGVLYGVRDFERRYADQLIFSGDYRARQTRPFIDAVPDFSLSSAPAVENRGLWTWGHVVYDYRGYIDNMSRWKLNTLILWNDFAPVNARDIIEYAHARGVKVIWGFSWGWGTGEDMHFGSEEEVAKWTRTVVKRYQNEYADLGGDGIYFQTSTECDEKNIDGVPIAVGVTNWVNRIGRALLDRYPDLWIQFGLHATAVKSNFRELAAVDPRITITWEDAGSFPFAYHAGQIDDVAGTVSFTSKIAGLRGDNEDFGMVLKGICSLYWPEFEPQKGPFILGESDKAFRKKRAGEIKPYIRYEQSFWLKNLAAAQEVVKAAVRSSAKRLTVTSLVEDGLWEEKQWLPAALMAETLWDPYEKPEDTVFKVASAAGADFA